MAHVKQTDRNNLIYEQYLSGKSQVQIAAEVGISLGRVHQIVLRLRCQHAAAEGRLNEEIVRLGCRLKRAIKPARKPVESSAN